MSISEEPVLEWWIFVAPEVDDMLASNRIGIADLLLRNGVDVEHRSADSRGAVRVVDAERSPTRDVATILIATAALVAAATPLLGQAISALSRKSALVEERTPVPLEDSAGNTVTDSDGNPVVRWVSRSRYVQTAEQRSPREGWEVAGPMGIRISFERGAEERLTRAIPPASGTGSNSDDQASGEDEQGSE